MATVGTHGSLRPAFQEAADVWDEGRLAEGMVPLEGFQPGGALSLHSMPEQAAIYNVRRDAPLPSSSREPHCSEGEADAPFFLSLSWVPF